MFVARQKGDTIVEPNDQRVLRELVRLYGWCVGAPRRAVEAFDHRRRMAGDARC